MEAREARFIAKCLNRITDKGFRITSGKDIRGLMSNIRIVEVESGETIPVTDEMALELASMVYEILSIEHELVLASAKTREVERKLCDFKCTLDVILSGITNRDEARALEAMLHKKAWSDKQAEARDEEV